MNHQQRVTVMITQVMRKGRVLGTKNFGNHENGKLGVRGTCDIGFQATKFFNMAYPRGWVEDWCV